MAARSLALALLVACAGPATTVDQVAVAASPIPGDVRVTGTLVNHNAGHGTVELEITLRGPVVVRFSQTMAVEANERLALALDIPAPAGSYSAEVVPVYPN
jgi:hypothetical protein